MQLYDIYMQDITSVRTC